MEETRMPSEAIALVDTGQFGVRGYGAAYVLRTRHPALVDSGTSLAKDRLLAGVRQAGVEASDIRWIFITHVHPDHAGGAGVLLPHFPRATVVVHPEGFQHLANPERLSASAQRSTGAMAHHYGSFAAIPEQRLHAAQDAETFSLGDGLIRALHTPGHAPHHLCFLEEESRALFTGDAVGLWRNRSLLPATVPPQFDLADSLRTLEHLRAREPQHLLFTHFGHGADADGILQAYARELRAWVERVRCVLNTEGDEGAALRQLLNEPDLRALPFNETAPEAELSMSIRGVLSYLRRGQRGQR